MLLHKHKYISGNALIGLHVRHGANSQTVHSHNSGFDVHQGSLVHFGEETELSNSTAEDREAFMCAVGRVGLHSMVWMGRK